MFEVRGVTKRFGGLVAVADATVSVRAGEIVGLIGPNGAGKSTLFGVISGVHRPDEGGVYIDDAPLPRLKPHQLARKGIVRTSQTPAPFSSLSVFDNVLAAAYSVERSERGATSWADECVARVGLADVGAKPASSLPLGMRKRLEVGRAMAVRPRLLLLDEVLGGLNPEEMSSMVELIRSLRAEGMAVCMVEHVMAVIMTLCDRIYVLHHGAVIAHGTPGEISRNEAVLTAYLGEQA